MHMHMYMSIARVADRAKLFDALCSAIAGEIAAGDCSRQRRVGGSTYSLVALSCNTRTTYTCRTTRVQRTAGIQHTYSIQLAYITRTNVQLAYNTRTTYS